MVKKQQESTEKNRNILLAVFLFIVMGIAIYFLPCPTESQYIYFRFGLALVAGLFGLILTGFIHVNLKWANLAVKATGGCGLFLIMLIMAPKLGSSSSRCAPQYTIILRDSSGRTIKNLKGHLNILIGVNVEKPEIKSDGSVDIKGITVDKENYRFNIELDADKWVFTRTHSKVIDTFFKNERLLLSLVADESLCCINGIVLDAVTQAPADSVTVALNGSTKKTGKDGSFSFYIPPQERETTQNLHIEKEGFAPIDKPVSVLLGTSETIYLHKL